jgi:hypothetical protein
MNIDKDFKIIFAIRFKRKGRSILFAFKTYSSALICCYTEKHKKTPIIKPKIGGGVRGIFFGGPAARFCGPVTLRPRIAPGLLISENNFSVIY